MTSHVLTRASQDLLLRCDLYLCGPGVLPDLGPPVVFARLLFSRRDLCRLPFSARPSRATVSSNARSRCAVHAVVALIDINRIFKNQPLGACGFTMLNPLSGTLSYSELHN